MASQIGNSDLERLPTEIHQKIYRYLLKADCVRQPYDFNHPHQIDFYRFQTSLFRVSSTIRLHAETTLYNENHFTVVKHNCPVLLTLLQSFEVAVVCSKTKIVEKFTRYSMKLTLKIPWSWLTVAVDPYVDKAGCNRSLLLVQRDLDSFVHMLKVFYWMNHDTSTPSYLTLSFPFHPSATASAIQIERNLLEPFRGLNQNIHVVEVQHPVDVAFAEGLVQRMMPPVRWARMAAWRFYDEMAALKNVADICMRHGKLEAALVKYEDCLHFLHVGAASLMARRLEDDGFIFSCRRLMFTCRVDLLLINLKGKAWEHGVVTHSKTKSAEIVLKKARGVPVRARHITTEANVRQLYYRAIASVTLGRRQEALTLFAAALLLDPGNEDIHNDMTWTKNNGKRNGKRNRKPDDLLRGNSLPNEPLGVPPPVFFPSPRIQSERYLLRCLGYNGDMLPHIHASEDADTEKMDRIARRFQQELQLAGPRRAWNNWITTEEVEVVRPPTDSLVSVSRPGTGYKGFDVRDRDFVIHMMRVGEGRD